MDYHKLNATIIDKVLKAMAIINNPEIEPEVRQLNQEILFREVGAAVYAKVYEMNAFDFEIEHTRGSGINDSYFGLAKVAAASVALGTLALDQIVRNFLDNTAAKAQYDASLTAKESGKRTRVIRRPRGVTCEWCRSLAGVYDDPDPEIFARHRKCDCSIITEGYRSRNGLLNNYVKA